MPSRQIVNAFTVDVEDYFQVSALAPFIARDAWDQMPCRVERNVDRLLQRLDQHGTKGTFFALGWLAQRYPQLIRRIAQEGHEVASHGYGHLRAFEQSRSDFTSDISRAKKLIEDITGMPVLGYRAPSFSIGASNLWAFECLAEAGYKYSSSVYPVKHDHYGMPDSPRFPYLANQGVAELPITTVRMLGRNWPAGGGGYFRFAPYSLSRWAIERFNDREQQPAIFYMHPWEIDPDQPRVEGVGAKARFRHYVNLHRTERRLERLLSDFKWGRVDQVFSGQMSKLLLQ